MAKHKTRLTGVWGVYWKKYGDKMKAETGIGSFCQADKYVIVYRIYEDKILHEIYGESLADMPTNVYDIYKAYLSYNKKSKKTAESTEQTAQTETEEKAETDDKQKKKSKKPSKASQDKEKIKTYADSIGYSTLKIPRDKMQKRFILSLIESQAKLKQQLEAKQKVALTHSMNMKKLKVSINKKETQIAKLLASNNQFKNENKAIRDRKKLLLNQMIKKDSKIRDLIDVCSKEIRKRPTTQTESHLYELMNTDTQNNNNNNKNS